MNSARCLLFESNLDRKYWPEVIKTVNYLKNRTFTISTLELKTPFEIFFNEKPNIKNLKLYGSKVFVRTLEVKRSDKWDRKFYVGTLVGYENVGYRVLLNNRIMVARHVDIIEDNEKLIGFRGYENNSDDDDNESLSSKSQNSESRVFDENCENENSDNKMLNVKDKLQIRKSP